MFRRVEAGLPPDPKWPADLAALGYHVNQANQIRKDKAPTEGFQFFITNNDRYNEVHREAMHACLRDQVVKQMSSLDHIPLYLPQLSNTKPHGAHIPIFAPPLEKLKIAKRLIVVVNDQTQDLGIWSYRILSGEGGVTGGSSVGFVGEVKKRLWPTSNSDPTANKPGPVDEAIDVSADSADAETAVIILNAGALRYSYKLNTTLTLPSWNALPRSSAVHPPVRVKEENQLQGHKSPAEHLQTVFETVINNPDLVDANAELYIVGLSDGGDTLLRYLDNNWELFDKRVQAIAFTQPTTLPHKIANPELITFLTKRARSWVNCAAEKGACVAMPQPDTGIHEPVDVKSAEELQFSSAEPEPKADPVLCPTFSSAQEQVPETIFPAVMTSTLDLFSTVAEAVSKGEDFAKPDFEVQMAPEEAPSLGLLPDAPQAPDSEALVPHEQSLPPRTQIQDAELDDIAGPDVVDVTESLDPNDIRVGSSRLSDTSSETTVNTPIDDAGDAPRGNEIEHEQDTNDDNVLEIAGVKVSKDLVQMAGLGQGAGLTSDVPEEKNEKNWMKSRKQIVQSGD